MTCPMIRRSIFIDMFVIVVRHHNEPFLDKSFTCDEKKKWIMYNRMRSTQ